MLRTVARDSLARNSVLIMASTVGTAGLGYLYWLLAAHRLSPSAIGAATALISLSTVVSMVSNLGIGHMFIQRLPGTGVREWSRIVGAGLLLGCGATAVASFVAAGLLPSLAGTFVFLRSTSGTVALVTTAVALTATTLLDYIFIADRSSHGMLTRNLALAVGKVVTLAALTWAGYQGPGVVLIAWTLPSLGVTAYTLTTMIGRLRPGARLDGAGVGLELRHIQGSLSGHHLINLAQAGPTALLPVLVTARLGAEANGHFYVAWMTASILFMVSPAVASAFYAERTNSAATGLPRAAAVVFAVIGPPALLLFLAGDRILGLFSAGFAAEGELLLRILVLAALPDAITNLAVAHWRSLGQFRRCLRLNLLMATVCLALTWLWLPGTGIEAAGIAWLAGQSVGALAVAIFWIKSRRKAPAA
ncbi:sugar transporter [Actinoplanes bogorensis]|uniref:Sugar transporter n=1 Tax=Paractinoplanes bogorensis TaxID=1610840 RepID=A0ABS5YKW4_9ACTN|nr:sugar transporter [Actinoplanes bogorensis]MBU2662595.1 sugar transporter [Actinoplanes bogorensis]